MPYLTILQKGQETQRTLKRAVVVGRSDQADLQIQDPLVSRKHCRFEQTDDGWMVVDLNSRNGTYVNGHRVRQYVLRGDERIEVGDTILIYHAGALVSARPADPREAVLRARLENEVEGTSEDTIGFGGRELPKPQVKPASAADKRAARVSGASSVWKRPRPTPQIATADKAAQREAPTPPRLFTRLLGRRYGLSHQG